MPSVYETPRALVPANEHLGMRINRGWGWNWTGRQRWDGRVRTYYTRASFASKADLKAAMGQTFPGVEFIDGAPADREPGIVLVMPPESFQGGILKKIIEANRPPRDVHRTLPKSLTDRRSLLS